MNSSGGLHARLLVSVERSSEQWKWPRPLRETLLSLHSALFESLEELHTYLYNPDSRETDVN